MRLRIVASATLALTLAAGTALVAAPAAASRAQGPSLDEPDPARVAELVGQGFGEGEALFLALTTVKGKAIGDDRVRLTDSFPTGNKAVVNIRVVPEAGEVDPGALKVKTDDAGGKFKFSLKYFVSYDAIPVEARPDVPGTSAASFRAPAQGGDDPHGVQVLVQGLVDQFRGDKVDAFVEVLDKKLDSTALDKMNSKLKAGLLAQDLLAMGAELDALLAEIDALEECAKNPTKATTKKAYKENPGERDRILKEIAATRAELKGNTAAMVIGAVNSAGSGLIKGVPWLGYIIGPGTSWALENFKQVAQDRMNELRKGVVSCEFDLKVDGTVGTPPAHITAVKCGGPVGVWDIAYTQPGAISAGHITVTLAGDKASASGTWSAAGTAGGQGSGNGGSVTYAGSPDGSSGTLTFSLLGSAPVTGGEFCANGVPTGG